MSGNESIKLRSADVEHLGGGEYQSGLKSLRFPDGTHVGRLDQGHYRVNDGDEFPELTSNDPAFP
jgi:hypothetical protein